MNPAIRWLLVFVLGCEPALASADVVWDVSLWGKRRAFTEHVEKLAELLERGSGGEFRLRLSYGELSPNRENLNGIQKGAFEMAQICAFYHPDKTPSLTVNELPYIRPLSLSQVSETYQAVYRHPVVIADLQRWNATLLMPTPLPQYSLMGAGRPVASINRFWGKRVRGPVGTLGVLHQLGAVRSDTPYGQVAARMAAGKLDVAAFAPHAHIATGLIEQAAWASENLALGSADCPIVVNTEAQQRLPLAFRSLLANASEQALQHYIRHYETRVMLPYQQQLEQRGIERLVYRDDELLELERLAADVRQQWVLRHKRRFDSVALYQFAERQFLSRK